MQKNSIMILQMLGHLGVNKRAGRMEQNKENHSEVNIPNNPYTFDYDEYIAQPGVVNTGISKGKRITSLVLCIVSSVLLFAFCVFWSVVTYINMGEVNLTVDASLAYSAMLFVYFGPLFLATAIVAKILNRKSVWALINIILSCLALVVIMILSVILPSIS